MRSSVLLTSAFIWFIFRRFLRRSSSKSIVVTTIVINSESDFREYLRWYSSIVFCALAKLKAEYHVESEECFVQTTLYWRMSRFNRLFRISSSSYSSSSWLFTIIDDDDEIICSDKESFATKRNKKIWNVSCSFIEDEKSSWHALDNIFLMTKKSIILWSNFADDRVVRIFFVDNQIFCLTSYSDEEFSFLFACVF
jgi:hypothetical protein